MRCFRRKSGRPTVVFGIFDGINQHLIIIRTTNGLQPAPLLVKQSFPFSLYTSSHFLFQECSHKTYLFRWQRIYTGSFPIFKFTSFLTGRYPLFCARTHRALYYYRGTCRRHLLLILLGLRALYYQNLRSRVVSMGVQNTRLKFDVVIHGLYVNCLMYMDCKTVRFTAPVTGLHVCESIFMASWAGVFRLTDLTSLTEILKISVTIPLTGQFFLLIITVRWAPVSAESSDLDSMFSHSHESLYHPRRSTLFRFQLACPVESYVIWADTCLALL